MTDTATTYDIAALEALRERVRAATGPDRDLDWELERLFHPDAPVFRIDPKNHKPTFGDDGHSWTLNHAGYVATWVFPKLSASLDACAALQAEVLPGALMGFWNMEDGPGARIIPSISGHDYVNAPDIAETAATMPLAWLSAILSALIAMHREAVNV